MLSEWFYVIANIVGSVSDCSININALRNRNSVLPALTTRLLLDPILLA